MGRRGEYVVVVGRRERQPAFGDRRQTQQAAQLRELDGGDLGDTHRGMLTEPTRVGLIRVTPSRRYCLTAVTYRLQHSQ